MSYEQEKAAVFTEHIFITSFNRGPRCSSLAFCFVLSALGGDYSKPSNVHMAPAVRAHKLDFSGSIVLLVAARCDKANIDKGDVVVVGDSRVVGMYFFPRPPVPDACNVPTVATCLSNPSRRCPLAA